MATKTQYQTFEWGYFYFPVLNVNEIKTKQNKTKKNFVDVNKIYKSDVNKISHMVIIRGK